jgi:hypothetical protein
MRAKMVYHRRRIKIMKTFLKYFSILFLIQIVLLIAFWTVHIGDGIVYVAYMTPYMLLDLIIPIPKQFCSGDGSFSGFMCLNLLLAIPAFLYSIFFAAILYGISRIFRPTRTR